MKLMSVIAATLAVILALGVPSAVTIIFIHFVIKYW